MILFSEERSSFQKYGLLPCRLLEVFYGRLGPVFVSGGDVHFDVLG